jgi:hypothetical protein
MAEKSSWDQANIQQKLGLVWRNRRKLAKLSKTTFTYRSSSYLFYEFSPVEDWKVQIYAGNIILHAAI